MSLVGEADNARTAHARYFASREADVLALWDGPRQREAYEWFTLELANLRAAFRWAADHSDLDSAAAIAVYAAFLGFWIEQHEPIGWARGAYRTREGRRPSTAGTALLDVRACYAAGRSSDALAYAEAGRRQSQPGGSTMSRTSSKPALGGAYIV